MILVAFVFCLLAAIGWAAAWQTMHWLGQAEDLLEFLRDHWRWFSDDGRVQPARLSAYERRTPRRPS